MEKEIMFLYGTAFLSFAFAAVNGVLFWWKCGRTGKTTATVVSYKTVSAESMKRLNSKWAQVSYKVNQKVYNPTQRIQVPMTAVIGSKITVRYDREQPRKLYCFSVKRIVAGGAIGIICLAIAVGKSIYL